MKAKENEIRIVNEGYQKLQGDLNNTNNLLNEYKIRYQSNKRESD